jgi:hypothetical protein
LTRGTPLRAARRATRSKCCDRPDGDARLLGDVDVPNGLEAAVLDGGVAGGEDEGTTA